MEEKNMKTKQIILSAVLVALSATAVQANILSSLQYGVETGINMQKMDSKNTDAKIGFRVGATATHEVNENLNRFTKFLQLTTGTTSRLEINRLKFSKTAG